MFRRVQLRDVLPLKKNQNNTEHEILLQKLNRVTSGRLRLPGVAALTVAPATGPQKKWGVIFYLKATAKAEKCVLLQDCSALVKEFFKLVLDILSKLGFFSANHWAISQEKIGVGVVSVEKKKRKEAFPAGRGAAGPRWGGSTSLDTTNEDG